jgi:hypothetical protein
MKRILIAVLMLMELIAVAAVVGPSWEHHDIRPVACYDRPGQPC